jgi:photosystem II stability/assembly factor-like uncharacterized protein
MTGNRLGIAIGCGLLIGGASVTGSLAPWSVAARPARTTRMFDPSRVWFLNSSVGWVEDDYAERLLMTRNGGRTWVNVSPPELGRPRPRGHRTLASVLFESGSNFWAAVFDSPSTGLTPVKLLHTGDAGRTWTDVGSFARSDGEVWIDFSSRRRGWVMVGNGAEAGNQPVTIYRTNPGGAHWTELGRSAEPMQAGTPGAPSADCDKTGISFSNATAGWITGFCNGVPQLDHTRDGGAHWRSVPLSRHLHHPERGW